MRNFLHQREDGFTLVELLVVVIVIGILAAIAIPRFLSQRERANNSTALSDLRNLVVIETALEAGPGLSASHDVVTAQGWQATSDQIRVCGVLSAEEDDITLAAWHLGGSIQYTYIRSVGVIESNEATMTATCTDQGLSGAQQMWPDPTP